MDLPILYLKGEMIMRRKYSIGIILLTFLLIYLIYDFSNVKENPQNQIVQAEEEHTPISFDEASYYLYEVNGYIVVFLNDRKTPYEYTDILYDELPEMLKKEIKNGKYVKDKEELYGFLENYSS